MNIVEKMWGYEDIRLNEPDYCLKFLMVKKGGRSSVHYHPRKKESFVWMSGQVVLNRYKDGKVRSSTNICEGNPGPHTIQPGEQHSFRGMEDSVIAEVSTHDDPEDCVRLTPSSYNP